MSILTFKITIATLNSDIDYSKIRRLIIDFLNQQVSVNMITILIVYTILNLMVFQKDFLQRMDYWFKKIILYRPKPSDYPEPINNLPLIVILVLSIVLVHMTGIYSYVQVFVYEVGVVLKDGIVDLFTVPIIFNFIVYFWFQGMLRFIKFLDNTENKQ